MNALLFRKYVFYKVIDTPNSLYAVFIEYMTTNDPGCIQQFHGYLETRESEVQYNSPGQEDSATGLTGSCLGLNHGLPHRAFSRIVPRMLNGHLKLTSHNVKGLGSSGRGRRSTPAQTRIFRHYSCQSE